MSKVCAVHLKNKGLSAVRSRHPWIFEDSIEKIPSGLKHGDIAVVFDGRKKVGAGLVDPTSDVRIRMLSFGASAPDIGPELFEQLARKALQRREGLFGGETNAYRLVNGESDSFPGLVVDQYNDVLCFKVYTAAFLPHLPEVIAAFQKLKPRCGKVCIRLSREVANLSPRILAGYEDGMLLGDDLWNGEVQFLENNLCFETNVRTGQKTGFFLDQRDNRARVGHYAASCQKVLNVFSYSGGFSLYAARAGAQEVTDLDFSGQALAASERNFKLNEQIPNVRNCRHRTLENDAFIAMPELEHKGERFDIVIVDPPSFAKASAERKGALNSYRKLAALAVRLVKKNGLLVFASCSSRVASDELFEAVHQTARELKRPIRELERHGEAPDHPADFIQSHYLKCMYGRL